MTSEHSVAVETAPMTLWKALSAIPDHRHAAGRRYPLAALLTIAFRHALWAQDASGDRALEQGAIARRPEGAGDP